MTDEATIGGMFELAIVAEKAAQELYQGFEKLFAHQPDVADFWAGYAVEEARHAQWLEQIRGRATPEQLSAPVDPLLWQDARHSLPLPVTEVLGQVQNLDDAYELANHKEHSEINVVFEFLISSSTSDETTHLFLRSQLRDHIARLMFDFPAPFKSATRRRAVQAIPGPPVP